MPLPYQFGPSIACPRRPRSVAPRHVSVAFATPNLNALSVRSRQLRRSLEFWRRVIAIWTSFKVTQAYVALQRRFRKPDWPAKVWSEQHVRAGDRMLDLCTTLKGFYVKSGTSHFRPLQPPVHFETPSSHSHVHPWRSRSA